MPAANDDLPEDIQRALETCDRLLDEHEKLNLIIEMLAELIARVNRLTAPGLADWISVKVHHVED